MNITGIRMTKAKKRVFMANVFNDTLIRNSTAFHPAEELDMMFVPDTAAVEFWIDGEYRGAYTIGGIIEVDKNRLPLTDPLGIIVELDNEFYAQKDYYFYDTYLGRRFAIREAVDGDTPGQAKTAQNLYHTKLDAFLA